MSQSQDWITETVSSLPALCTADEASGVLRTSPRNLRRMVALGRITGVHFAPGGSSRMLVPRSSIENFLRGLVSP